MSILLSDYYASMTQPTQYAQMRETFKQPQEEHARAIWEGTTRDPKPPDRSGAYYDEGGAEKGGAALPKAYTSQGTITQPGGQPSGMNLPALGEPDYTGLYTRLGITGARLGSSVLKALGSKGIPDDVYNQYVSQGLPDKVWNKYVTPTGLPNGVWNNYVTNQNWTPTYVSKPLPGQPNRQALQWEEGMGLEEGQDYYTTESGKQALRWEEGMGDEYITTDSGKQALVWEEGMGIEGEEGFFNTAGNYIGVAGQVAGYGLSAYNVGKNIADEEYGQAAVSSIPLVAKGAAAAEVGGSVMPALGAGMAWRALAQTGMAAQANQFEGSAYGDINKTALETTGDEKLIGGIGQPWLKATLPENQYEKLQPLLYGSNPVTGVADLLQGEDLGDVAKNYAVPGWSTFDSALRGDTKPAATLSQSYAERAANPDAKTGNVQQAYVNLFNDWLREPGNAEKIPAEWMNQAYYGNQANWLAMMEKDPASRQWFNDRLAQTWEDLPQEGQFYGGGTAGAPFMREPPPALTPEQYANAIANWGSDYGAP